MASMQSWHGWGLVTPASPHICPREHVESRSSKPSGVRDVIKTATMCMAFPGPHAVPGTNSLFLSLGGSCFHDGHVWGEETGAEMGRHLHKVVPASGPALGSPISLDAALSTQGGWWPAMEVGPEAGFVLT